MSIIFSKYVSFFNLLAPIIVRTGQNESYDHKISRGGINEPQIIQNLLTFAIVISMFCRLSVDQPSLEALKGLSHQGRTRPLSF